MRYFVLLTVILAIVPVSAAPIAQDVPPAQRLLLPLDALLPWLLLFPVLVLARLWWPVKLAHGLALVANCALAATHQVAASTIGQLLVAMSFIVAVHLAIPAFPSNRTRGDSNGY